MNRLINTFNEKDKNILNIYYTAGFPSLHSTLYVMKQLEQAGADIIELGIPFSDPLADGPDIQQSSEIALNNGMSIDLLFDQLNGFRKTINIPVVLMGYLNPVMQYGLEKFIKRSAEIGLDGFIFPDVPTNEFENEWKELLVENNLCFSFLVTPETSDERIKLLDQLSSGFLYAVSTSGTTGTKDVSAQEHIGNYLDRLNSLNLKNPILAGFGIKNAEDFEFVNSKVSGAIIGSAFIKDLHSKGCKEETIFEFITEIKKGVLEKM